MSLALPAAPAPPPRREVFVGTALVGLAMLMLTAGMLGIWILMRERSIAATGTWVPEDVTVPEVPSNVMLIGVLSLCLFAQWAVYAAKRRDRAHVGLALGIVALFAVAIINAQAFIDSQIAMEIVESSYPACSGRRDRLDHGLVRDRPGLPRRLPCSASSAAAWTTRNLSLPTPCNWYALAVVFSAVWLVVYVTAVIADETTAMAASRWSRSDPGC